MPSIPQKCSIEDCNKQRSLGRKGWCLMHYTRWVNNGDPLITKYDRQHKDITKIPEYAVWNRMKNRCYNPNAKNKKDYGGRGITICDRWRNSFWAFYEDMGVKPSTKYSLDRIDNNGNYEPGNCRWATRKQQASNRRSNRLVTINGETKTLKQWCEYLNLNYKTVHQRLTMGWDMNRSLNL